MSKIKFVTVENRTPQQMAAKAYKWAKEGWTVVLEEAKLETRRELYSMLSDSAPEEYYSIHDQFGIFAVRRDS